MTRLPDELNPFLQAARARKAAALSALLLEEWARPVPQWRNWFKLDVMLGDWPEPLRVKLAERAGVHPPSAKTWEMVCQTVQAFADAEYKRLGRGVAA